MKKNKKLIIFGSGKFADFIAYSFENDSDYEISAFCVEHDFLTSSQNKEFNVPVIAFENIKEKYPPEKYDFFIAIGNDKIREKIFKKVKTKGYFLPNFISSNTIIPKNIKLLGENIFVGEGSGIQPFVSIKSNSYVIGARIGHHTTIEQNCLLSVCLIGAEVEIGQNTFIGLNTTISPKIKIGKNNIIGMGALITKDTADFEVYSAPASKKRSLSYNDIADFFL